MFFADDTSKENIKPLGRQPLREKLNRADKDGKRRMSYVNSTRVDTPDGTHYHVDMREEPGTEKVTWIEKATQRDYAIGLSVGGFIVLALTTFAAMTGVAVPAAALYFAVPACGLIGGVSDYIRNDRELKKGVDIGPPKRFNRDAIKSAFGYGFIAKFAVVGIAAALAASGMAIPGLEGITEAWNAAAGSGIGGVLSQVFSVGNAIPNEIGWASLGIGATYGAAKGSEIGYARMHREYQAAMIKADRPAVGVAVPPEPSQGLFEAIVNIVAPTLFPLGTAGDAIAATASAKSEKDTSKEHNMWHPADDRKPGFSFVKAETARREDAGVSQERTSEQASSKPDLGFSDEVLRRHPDLGFADETRRRQAATTSRGLQPAGVS
jgi:hypothetical protein